jgi:hypothetical protein
MRCHTWGEWAIFCFFVGSKFFLVSVMIYMYSEFYFVYASYSGAVVAMILLAVGVVAVVVLRLSSPEKIEGGGDSMGGPCAGWWRCCTRRNQRLRNRHSSSSLDEEMLPQGMDIDLRHKLYYLNNHVLLHHTTSIYILITYAYCICDISYPCNCSHVLPITIKVCEKPQVVTRLRA